MTRRRRALLLLGLALALGGLAASDISRREAEIAERIGPLAPVVIARVDLPTDKPMTADQLTVRQVPARFRPEDSYADVDELVGARLGVPVPAGADLTPAQLGAPPGQESVGAPVRPGERVVALVAVGSPELIEPGTHVDVLVTREPQRGGPGQTIVALEDVEVLSASTAHSDSAAESEAPHVTAQLRVSVRQALFLTAAENFAREVRLLPRAAGDRRRGATGVAVDDTLG